MTGPAHDGLLLLDKPTGPTSHDMITYVRRNLGIRRVGHTGTLDPFASGLLLVAVGRATRLIRFLPDGPKTYVGQLQLGVRTDTDDLTGSVIERHDGRLPDLKTTRAAATGLTGRTTQVPPTISAKKIDGRRAYRLAREGKPVRTRPVEVVVDRFDVDVVVGREGVFSFVATVSAGTYVRALARDLGQALGCGGALLTLRRTMIGPLSVEDAFAPGPPVDGTASGVGDRRTAVPDHPAGPGLAARVVPIDALPLTPTALVLVAPEDIERFLHGLRVDAPHDAGPGPRTVRDSDGRLLGIADLDAGGVRPRVVLAAP